MKKILALILSIVMLSTCCIFATANGTDSFVSSEQSAVTPRYIHLSYVSAGIDEKALGFVICESTYNCAIEDYTFVLTCTLQRTDGSAAGWQTYKTATETFTDTGTNVIDKTWFAPAGYAYRTFTTVVVKNSRTQKVVETATCASPTIYK